MKFSHALEEAHLSLDDVKELLARFGRRAKTDEIDRMTRVEGIADFTLGLEAADARPLAGARVNHDDRPFARIDLDAGRRNDARKCIVDWPGQRSSVHQHLMAEAQDRRHRARCDLDLFVAAPAQQIEEKHAALKRIDQVFRPRRHQVFGRRHERVGQCGQLQAQRAFRK